MRKVSFKYGNCYVIIITFSSLSHHLLLPLHVISQKSNHHCFSCNFDVCSKCIKNYNGKEKVVLRPKCFAGHDLRMANEEYRQWFCDVCGKNHSNLVIIIILLLFLLILFHIITSTDSLLSLHVIVTEIQISLFFLQF
jgi:ribosomal protein L31